MKKNKKTKCVSPACLLTVKCKTCCFYWWIESCEITLLAIKLSRDAAAALKPSGMFWKIFSHWSVKEKNLWCISAGEYSWNWDWQICCLQFNLVLFLEKPCFIIHELCSYLTKIKNFCMLPFSSNYNFPHCEFLQTSLQNCKNCPLSTSQCKCRTPGKTTSK